MNKAELINSISEKTGFEKSKSEIFLNAFMESSIEAIKTDGKIQLVGFGTFIKRYREAHVGHDPRSGNEINIPANNSVSFKPGKTFKEAINL